MIKSPVRFPISSAIRGLTIMIMSFVVSGLFTSCDPDYDEELDFRLVGTWDLISINGGPVPYGEESSYSFGPDGEGYLYQYDEYGDWVNYPVTWFGDNNIIDVNPLGWGEVWTYSYTVVPYSYLYLTDMATGNNLTYQYVR